MVAANAQAAGLKSQAAWQERQAKIEGMKTGYANMQQRRQTSRVLGANRAEFAAGGVIPSADVEEAVLQESNMAIAGRTFQGEEAEARLRFEAANARAQVGPLMAGAALSAVGNVASTFASGVTRPTGTSLVRDAFQPSAPTQVPYWGVY
jgi:hypothetical protein